MLYQCNFSTLIWQRIFDSPNVADVVEVHTIEHVSFSVALKSKVAKNKGSMVWLATC